ncbi:YihY/virulence factor BrkB family protein [Streptantibioticus ferralitis]|uniref:YihY/virulence factor BrkB family protein n=1 Tax=Streptantibioticus ferralitis TaxID=236510 RepID=A0ABT5Z216_9ACTN|nr:YihY/virulence factor BrkB family protein [Streptantibioticus ferralitis]MDF2257884.1 YihY/virulence factor BrkB family protein [Streptantibioticus ferralitis]
MDWLTRLPLIGPLIARAMRTHAWCAFEHAQRAQWSRLAAAITFTSFIALFPLLTVGAAVGAAVLSSSQLHTLEQKLSQQVPGLSQQIDIGALAANAGTVGLVAGVVLLLAGVSWIGQLRGCLRAIWGQDEDRENPFLRKVKDAGVLVGLAAVGLFSLAGSTLATGAVGWAARHLGLAHNGAGGGLLTVAGFCIAVLADFLLLVYLLTWLPGVRPSRHSVVVAALLGAFGLEILKILLSGYLQGVAARSMYGAFGTPVALLLWINFMAKLLLYCAAWTATPAAEAATARSGGEPDGSGKAPDASPEPSARTGRDASAGASASVPPSSPRPVPPGHRR